MSIKPCSLIVLTGGPGAGKTATLEIVRKRFLEHISIVPEAASIIYGGGFWRRDGLAMKKAAQRAIYHVQRELEHAIVEDGNTTVALCDRGTLDGLAYWPEAAESFWQELGITREAELKRYAAVIHLRTPNAEHGYNHQNPIRTENAREASVIDERIVKAWEGHPNRIFIESTENFLEKVRLALEVIKKQLIVIQNLPENAPAPARRP
ncbi:MAG: ATP-binding protein [Deltaproteobacteria bacterium]|nr:ATP-binding protein [Deltaproteobacteria bacterium]